MSQQYRFQIPNGGGQFNHRTATVVSELQLRSATLLCEVKVARLLPCSVGTAPFYYEHYLNGSKRDFLLVDVNTCVIL